MNRRQEVLLRYKSAIKYHLDKMIDEMIEADFGEDCRKIPFSSLDNKFKHYVIISIEFRDEDEDEDEDE